jgi:hypothetical protein
LKGCSSGGDGVGGSGGSGADACTVTSSFARGTSARDASASSIESVVSSGGAPSRVSDT